MANKRFVVKPSSEERKCLDAGIPKSRSSAKIILKARILLKAEQSEEGAGWADEKIKALDTNVAIETRLRRAGCGICTQETRDPTGSADLRWRASTPTDCPGLLEAASGLCPLDASFACRQSCGTQDRSHDAARPLVCLDETSKQLVAEARAPISVRPGKPARHDYKYERSRPRAFQPNSNDPFQRAGTPGTQRGAASNGPPLGVPMLVGILSLIARNHLM
jgi:hypothetical protein